ncbi:MULTISPECIES: anhydro-N-acetylmuramic acid kinase [unclassified Ectothiorhodospira]|uniref:anhydro-N-acetylmuramic acid kinase n=1 Tax=unclassified Ectothiorhodospira TaxID=2684909 RepID=UPI001EE88A14|nr:MULTISPECIES: anhydro-N-acetylmuramic acid kinase [unclassified Ectothiorhodospira]MCG5516812.1 anhydro-N-acetylmuramic acid kinase [Ectothiorhodospira sp. 9100]MCG5519796.1 anhydro-N-acetylmuramic acid kinase [Ectothiorhodospira sp. 9905]
MAEYFIGLISGTSMDGIDTALVAFDDTGAHCVATHGQPIPPMLTSGLRHLADPEHTASLDELGSLDVALGEVMAEAVLTLLEDQHLDPSHIVALGSHGQTVRHRPGATPPFSLQIGCPHHLAERTGLTVVADFRRRDMAAGGEGAPLVPGFHRAMLHSDAEDRVILNLGGIANITILPADQGTPLQGFDTGPANALMDAWIRHERGRPWDSGGAWAASGELDNSLLASMLEDPYFIQPPPKSTGTEYFNLQWIERQLQVANRHIPARNMQRTLAELTVASASDAILKHAPTTQRVLVCGGGAHNRTVMEGLGRRLVNATVESTEAVGLSPDWIEAMAFAWLARETLAGRPGNVPSVTGARKAVVLGSIHPGGVG